MSVGSVEAAGGWFGTTGTIGTTSTTGTGTTGTGSSGTSTSAADDKDMFLKLLVAQMKYQDPMNPTDSSQFLSQSAQFTALEKMQAVADQTAQLLGVQTAFGASSLMGRTVSYPGADSTTTTGTVRGVTFEASGPVLDVDGVAVPLASVLRVTSGTTTGATGDTSNA